MKAKRTAVSTGLRLPTELYDQLVQAAEDRDLSINFLVVRAVEEFLKRLVPAEEMRWTRDPE